MMFCRICGEEKDGIPFDEWVRPTFTDHDKLLPGDIICGDCLFWFDERSEELARIVGKDKPQRMRNYSHFIVDGEWIPLSKSDKVRMQEILLSARFPELAAIAESGQKHIAFRAPRNPVGATAGWVQFEEQALFVRPAELRMLLRDIETLYETFSKSEIETGGYKQYRVRKFGLERWRKLELRIAPRRGTPLFNLALFLAQKGSSSDTRTRKGGGTSMDNLAGDSAGLQKPLPAHDMGAVRERGPGGGVHEPPGQVRQLDLFADERDNQDRGRADPE